MPNYYQNFISQIKPIFNNLEISKYIFKDYENDDFLSLFAKILYVSIFIYLLIFTWRVYNKRNKNRKYKQRIINNEFGK
jgi:hypothetical protein